MIPLGVPYRDAKRNHNVDNHAVSISPVMTSGFMSHSSKPQADHSASSQMSILGS